MRKLLLALAIILISSQGYCNMRYSTLTPEYSQNNISALTNATIYCAFRANNVNGDQTIWSLGRYHGGSEYGLTIDSGNLTFRTAYPLFSGSEGRWKCPITAGTYYSVGVKYKFDGDDSADPTIYLNGVKQNLTEDGTPDGIPMHTSDVVVVGGFAIYIPEGMFLESQPFQGRIGDMYISTRIHTDDEMMRHTLSDLKGFSYYNQNVGGIMYCPMDEIGNGEAMATQNNTTPSADVSGAWTTKTQSTYWASCDEDNGSDYIQAEYADDNEEMIFNLTNFTLPSNAYVYCVDVVVKGYSSNADKDPKLRLKKGSNWLSNWTATFGIVTSTAFGTYFPSYTGEWNQSEINDMQLSITSPDMSGGETIRIYYAYANIYTVTEKNRDWIGNFSLMGKNTTGATEEGLTYR